MAEYTTLEQVKIRLKQFHIDSKSDSESSEVVFDHLEENPFWNSLSVKQKPTSEQKECTRKATRKRRFPRILKNFSPWLLILLCMTDRKPVKTSWQAIQRMVCREHGETGKNCLWVYFHLQKFYNPIEIEGFRRLCVTMLLIPVIRLQAAHFKGGGRCAKNKQLGDMN